MSYNDEGFWGSFPIISWFSNIGGTSIDIYDTKPAATSLFSDPAGTLNKEEGYGFLTYELKQGDAEIGTTYQPMTIGMVIALTGG